jgi:hypothetical protein
VAFAVSTAADPGIRGVVGPSDDTADTSQPRMASPSSRLPHWTPRTSSLPSRPSSPVSRAYTLPPPVAANADAADIYRIVSSKSLESSGDVIKPSGGETILVAPTADDGGAKQGSKCCA